MGKNILSYIIENRNLIAAKVGDSEYKWLVQNAIVILQSSNTKNLTDNSFRDECMA